jgi:hypothetical protein
MTTWLAVTRMSLRLSMLPSEFPEVADYPHLQRLLELQINMQFVDLRTLLRLPMFEHGLEGGCNLTATTLLCNIIAGASVLFWDSSPEALEKRGERGRRFKELMARHYPWSDADAIRGEEGAELLYEYTRNPLSHSLGVGKNPHAFPGAAGGRAVMLTKSANGLSEEQINHWLTAQDISGFPTIELEDGEYVIRVETLAAGVHRMLRALFADEEEAAKANETARVLLYGETPPADAG